MKSSLIFMAALMLAGCATLPKNSVPDPADPWERFNRASFKLNDGLDRAVLRPAARGYVKVVPRTLRRGVSNVFDNLDTVNTLINDTLQGKFKAAGHDLARMVLNSTLGLGGLLDPATDAGLQKNDEDFGQTLGKWGVKSGPYLMVPLFGPSTVRDLAGEVPDRFADPVHYLEDDSTRYAVTALEVVDLRAGLLSLDAQLAQSYDRYAFVRDTWLQNRAFKVRDGGGADLEDEALRDDSDPALAPEAEQPDSTSPN